MSLHKILYLATDSSSVSAVHGRQTGRRTGGSDGKGSGCVPFLICILATDSSRVKAVRGRQTGGRTGGSDGKGSGCVLV